MDEQFLRSSLCATAQPVRLAGGWWLVLIRSKRKVLLAGCWWLICSERKVLLAGGGGYHHIKLQKKIMCIVTRARAPLAMSTRSIQSPDASRTTSNLWLCVLFAVRSIQPVRTISLAYEVDVAVRLVASLPARTPSQIRTVHARMDGAGRRPTWRLPVRWSCGECTTRVLIIHPSCMSACRSCVRAEIPCDHFLIGFAYIRIRSKRRRGVAGFIHRSL
jgi:hypothetical protein